VARRTGLTACSPVWSSSHIRAHSALIRAGHDIPLHGSRPEKCGMTFSLHVLIADSLVSHKARDMGA